MKYRDKQIPGMFAVAALAVCFLFPCQTACSPRGENTSANAMGDKFVQMDINNDGKVVIEEFRASFPNMNEQAFVVIDKNGDKGIDRAEWYEFVENHGKPAKQTPPRDPMNNIPGDPLIPPPDSSDLPLMRPPLN